MSDSECEYSTTSISTGQKSKILPQTVCRKQWETQDTVTYNISSSK
ncbi:hypothetical protein HF086_011968 [Spodoptera exigua]|uniref:Uncharacterized protein n=1 Tax=Spodoptera exigua TaxID=7107 RepID=A0A922SBH8_SPOEX|nr:hypothetical protein HF086_011968 [Spodoptera exigua]